MNTRTGWALVAALSLITSLAAVAVSSPVVISEVAWAGTAASPNDEWIELYNRSQGPVDLAGWTLAFGDVVIHLGKVEGATVEVRTTVIPQGGFLLLERSDDSTISDVAADLVYRGTLSNAGVTLRLRDPSGAEVDTANEGCEGWAAGSATGPVLYASMERVDPSGADLATNWRTNDGVLRTGRDALGGEVNGTPRAKNSATTAAETIPTVRLLAPVTEGAAVSGLFIVTWTATDPDGPADGLRVDLYLSRDGGTSWAPLVENLANSGSYAWDTRAVPDGEAYALKVLATDRDAHSGVMVSPPFSVSNRR
jgi:hypothetical protein